MNYPHIAARVFNRPLMIEPHAFGAVLEALSNRMQFSVENIEAFKPDNAVRSESGYLVQDGVAVIEVFGELVNRSSFLGASSGLINYALIGQRVQAAVADPSVSKIMLLMDTPGGEVNGVFDLMNVILSVRGVKPIVAAIDGQASSAGFLIASACDRITVAPEGTGGSVGVVFAHAETSKKDAEEGLKVTFIHQGARKIDGNSRQPLSEEARANIESMTSKVMGLFVGAVAANRNIDVQAVLDTEANVFMGEDLVAVGFADEVISPREEFDRLRSDINASGRSFISANTGGSQMTQQSDNGTGAANPDTHVALVDVQARISAAVAAEREAGEQRLASAVELATNEAGATAVTADRDRIAKIIGSDQAAGRTKLAQRLAFSTDMGVEDALAMLDDAPKSVGATVTQFEAAMGKVGNPDVGPDDGEQAEQGEGVDAATAIMASARKAGLVA